MFENHFALRENPFTSGHQPRFVFPSREHQEALAHLRFGIENREPFVLITGEVGTGKTTALYDMLADWQGQVQVALINNSALTRSELLEEICLKFGFNLPSGSTKPQVLNQLERHLLAVRARGQRAILLLDEAQNLDRELLEEIRLLSNLEFEGEKLIQVFLVGQPELEERLARVELRQLRQRISVHYRLKPLSLPDTERYIHHRITVAGGYAPAVFPTDSCRIVHELSHGIPREINHICSQAMLGAFVDGSPTVRAEHVRGAASEIEFHSVIPEGGAGGGEAPRAAPPRRLPPLPPAAAPATAPAPAPAAAPPPAVTRAPVAAPAPAPPYPPARVAAPQTPAAPPPFFDEPPSPAAPLTPVAAPARAPVPPIPPAPPTPVTLPPFFDERSLSSAPPRWEPTRPPGADEPALPIEVPGTPAPQVEEPVRARAAEPAIEHGTRRFSPRRFPRDDEDDNGDRSVATLRWLVAALAVVAVVMGGVLLVRFKPWLPRPSSGPAPTESTATSATRPAPAAIAPAPTAAPVTAPTSVPTPALVPPRDSSKAQPPSPAAEHDSPLTAPGPRLMARPDGAAAAPAPGEGAKSKVVAATAVGAGAAAAGAAAPGSAGSTGSAGAHGSASAPASSAAPAAPDSSRRPAAAAAGTFGVAVGTFPDQASAESDRARLAGVTQLPALVRTVKADSVSRFELVLGSFASHADAERAASDLVTRGLVDEARVVAQVLPPAAPRRH
jgi:type II secretory pathway predicted ATPase ExeA